MQAANRHLAIRTSRYQELSSIGNEKHKRNALFYVPHTKAAKHISRLLIQLSYKIQENYITAYSIDQTSKKKKETGLVGTCTWRRLTMRPDRRNMRPIGRITTAAIAITEPTHTHTMCYTKDLIFIPFLAMKDSWVFAKSLISSDNKCFPLIWANLGLWKRERTTK